MAPLKVKIRTSQPTPKTETPATSKNVSEAPLPSKVAAPSGWTPQAAAAIRSVSVEAPTPFSTARLDVVGSVGKDHNAKSLSFDVMFGDERFGYNLKGSTQTEKHFLGADHLDYSGIRLMKTSALDGKSQIDRLPNSGSIDFNVRRRDAQEVTLAGIPMQGNFINQFFDDGLRFDGLTVAGVPSSGFLDYSILNGHYNVKSPLKFGDIPISSSIPGKTVVMDYDSFANRTTFSMRFGDLVITGPIGFVDATRTTVSTDSEGKVSTSNEVTGTTANYNLHIQRADGKPLKLAPPGTKETADDITMRKFAAFMELVSYDLLSE
jgi:hypothetical protein